MGLWSALTDGVINAEQARDIAIPAHNRTIAWCDRWITHYDNRLAYEKALLEACGQSDLLKPKARPKQPPLCNYRAPDGIRIENHYHQGEFSVYPQIDMTKAEYKAVYCDRKGTRPVEGSHRVRIVYGVICGGMSRSCVFLTDSKVHAKPDPVESKPVAELAAPVAYSPPVKTEQQKTADALRESLKTGVTVAVADQLFPTPPDLVERMLDLAEIDAGMTVLEPSAGTGNIVRAIIDRVDTEIVAYEIRQDLCAKLAATFPSYRLCARSADFLEVTDNMGEWPRIVMNPPFKNGQDIKHIQHACKMLKPGGRLVAICANGPRQNDQLKPLASHWEELPSGTFAGTCVRSVLMTIEG